MAVAVLAITTNDSDVDGNNNDDDDMSHAKSGTKLPISFEPTVNTDIKNIYGSPLFISLGVINYGMLENGAT